MKQKILRKKYLKWMSKKAAFFTPVTLLVILLFVIGIVIAWGMQCPNDFYSWEFFSPFGEPVSQGNISQSTFELEAYPWEKLEQSLTGTVVVFYKTGHIRFIAQYKTGKFNGDVLYFDKSGILSSLAQYADGEQVGMQLRLNETGGPKSIYFYATNGIWNREGRTWHTNGVLRQATYENNGITYSRAWNMRGKLIADGMISNRIEHGKFISYQLTGYPPVIEVYDNGVHVETYQEKEE